MFNYNYTNFKNLSDLRKAYPTLASNMEQAIKPGDWQNDTLYFWPTLADWSKYEVLEGQYCNILGQENVDIDFQDLPNLWNYLDFHKLGEDLKKSVNPGNYFIDRHTNYIVSTDNIFE